MDAPNPSLALRRLVGQPGVLTASACPRRYVLACSIVCTITLLTMSPSFLSHILDFCHTHPYRAVPKAEPAGASLTGSVVERTLNFVQPRMWCICKRP